MDKINSDLVQKDNITLTPLRKFYSSILKSNSLCKICNTYVYHYLTLTIFKVVIVVNNEIIMPKPWIYTTDTYKMTLINIHYTITYTQLRLQRENDTKNKHKIKHTEK